MEPLAAILTGVGPGVRVDEEMRGEGGRAFECLPTHLALKTSFLREINIKTWNLIPS